MSSTASSALPATVTAQTSGAPSSYSAVSHSDVNRAVRGGTRQDELRRASAEWASVLINQLLSTMNDSVMKSDFGHGGKGEEVFQGMLNQEYARQAAYKDSFGLTEIVYKALEKKENAGKARTPEQQEQIRKDLAVKAAKMAYASQAAHQTGPASAVPFSYGK